MKHLQSFRLFEAQTTSVLTPDQEAFLNACTEGTWSVNPETGLVDVDGDFDCSKRFFKSLQGVSFGQVSGYFSCSHNQLTTLAGAPQTVNEGFDCEDNQLTSLAGAPQTVGWYFRCEINQLTSLEGAPPTVDGRFHCDAFQLKQGEWNFSGWEKILTTGNDAARKLMKTLPYLDPAYWLELHRSNRRKFNDIWLECRQDPEVRKTALFQEVEAALSGRALKNLEDLQDLKDFGL